MGEGQREGGWTIFKVWSIPGPSGKVTKRDPSRDTRVLFFEATNFWACAWLRKVTRVGTRATSKTGWFAKCRTSAVACEEEHVLPQLHKGEQ